MCDLLAITILNTISGSLEPLAVADGRLPLFLDAVVSD